MTSDPKVPPELVRYVRDPIAEGFTVEIFEDLHHVLDGHIVELARKRGSTKSEQDIVQDWERIHRDKIEKKRRNVQKDFGALLPTAFISGNLKFEYLVQNGHVEFQSGAVPDDVVEIMQEFLEIVAYRDEIEG